MALPLEYNVILGGVFSSNRSAIFTLLISVLILVSVVPVFDPRTVFLTVSKCYLCFPRSLSSEGNVTEFLVLKTPPFNQVINSLTQHHIRWEDKQTGQEFEKGFHRESVAEVLWNGRWWSFTQHPHWWHITITVCFSAILARSLVDMTLVRLDHLVGNPDELKNWRTVDALIPKFTFSGIEPIIFSNFLLFSCATTTPTMFPFSS